jgi:hypothetical protein
MEKYGVSHGRDFFPSQDVLNFISHYAPHLSLFSIIFDTAQLQLAKLSHILTFPQQYQRNFHWFIPLSELFTDYIGKNHPPLCTMQFSSDTRLRWCSLMSNFYFIRYQLPL